MYLKSVWVLTVCWGRCSITDKTGAVLDFIELTGKQIYCCLLSHFPIIRCEDYFQLITIVDSAGMKGLECWLGIGVGVTERQVRILPLLLVKSVTMCTSLNLSKPQTPYLGYRHNSTTLRKLLCRLNEIVHSVPRTQLFLLIN